MTLPFIKMNGAGNDFVIFDARTQPLTLAPESLRALADRKNPVTKGCDQIIVMEPSQKADVFMRIYNADGSESSSCGNATRCVASLMEKSHPVIQTKAGLLECRIIDASDVCVNMGEPKLEWRDIPLSQACDTNALPIEGAPSAVSMGNPHMVFSVQDTATAPVTTLGPQLEHHPLFPERANVSFAQIVSEHEIKLRVWERGVGETLACGTAACATVVALHRRKLTGNHADVHLPGGILSITWDEQDNCVWMTGPVELEFKGELEL